jgi:CDP-glycerol glycerophosphotransferase
MKAYRSIRSKITDYVISGCEKFTYYFSKSWDIPKDKFLPIGLPRNDIFFNNYDDYRNKIKNIYKIDKNKKILLYAPTFRGEFGFTHREFNSLLDIEKLLDVLKSRFESDFVCLYRAHHCAMEDTKLHNIISVSDYPDMQELLCATDVLITDYSSSIWDFSFMFKPCFIFAPDLKNYRATQGFYLPIEEWPFPLSITNEELFNNIHSFNNEEYINDVKKHHNNLGSYETGHATEQFCNILFDK